MDDPHYRHRHRPEAGPGSDAEVQLRRLLLGSDHIEHQFRKRPVRCRRLQLFPGMGVHSGGFLGDTRNCQPLFLRGHVHRADFHTGSAPADVRPHTVRHHPGVRFRVHPATSGLRPAGGIHGLLDDYGPDGGYEEGEDGIRRILPGDQRHSCVHGGRDVRHVLGTDHHCVRVHADEEAGPPGGDAVLHCGPAEAVPRAAGVSVRGVSSQEGSGGLEGQDGEGLGRRGDIFRHRPAAHAGHRTPGGQFLVHPVPHRRCGGYRAHDPEVQLHVDIRHHSLIGVTAGTYVLQEGYGRCGRHVPVVCLLRRGDHLHLSRDPAVPDPSDALPDHRRMHLQESPLETYPVPHGRIHHIPIITLGDGAHFADHVHRPDILRFVAFVLPSVRRLHIRILLLRRMGRGGGSPAVPGRDMGRICHSGGQASL